MYRLTAYKSRVKDLTLDEIDDLPVYDGAVIYTYKVEKPIVQEKRNRRYIEWF